MPPFRIHHSRPDTPPTILATARPTTQWGFALLKGSSAHQGTIILTARGMIFLQNTKLYIYILSKKRVNYRHLNYISAGNAKNITLFSLVSDTLVVDRNGRVSYTDRRVHRGVLKIENAKVLNFDRTERDKSFALLRYNARAGGVT